MINFFKEMFNFLWVDTCWINNSLESKRISKFELNKYLENGWNIGRSNLSKYKRKSGTADDGFSSV